MLFGLIETGWTNCVFQMMMVGGFIIFAMCACAAFFNHHDSLKAAPEQGNRRCDGLALVRLNGFTAVEMVCEHCETAQPLHKGMCVACWLKLIRHLEFCDDCGRAWQPAPEDSKDICPRCRVKTGILAPADMSETEKHRKREHVPVTGKEIDYAQCTTIALTPEYVALMEKDRAEVNEIMSAHGKRAAKQTSKIIHDVMRTYENGATPYCKMCCVECKGEYCSPTCKEIFEASVLVDENSVEVI